MKDIHVNWRTLAAWVGFCHVVLFATLAAAWMWASGHTERAAHGYEPTREAAMAAFAASWRRTPDDRARYSITSSARASSVGGTSRPRALAVCRFMTNSNLVDCSTGRLAGFAPFRIRPV